MLYSLLGSAAGEVPLERRKSCGWRILDLEKAFDRVPREVVWWALRQMDVDGWHH